MFRHGKLLWAGAAPSQHQADFEEIPDHGGGVSRGDDSDHRRAKVTKRIFAAHKIFDKKTGGWFNGQTVVLLFLVTAKVSLPVGFRFYQPDPAIATWKKTDAALKQQGVKKSERPPRPKPRAAYPSKLDCFVTLLREFQSYHPDLRVKGDPGGCVVWQCGVPEPGGRPFPQDPGDQSAAQDAERAVFGNVQ
jgi:hypothetical protein